jgi:hypothetical protein
MRRLTLWLAILPFVPLPCLSQEDPAARAWQQRVATLPLDASAAARALNEIYARTGLPLTYWIRSSIPDSLLTGLIVSDHPCGSAALVHWPTIPPTDARLQGERVVEIDSTGRELRRWPVPIDQWPQGLRGDELLLSLQVGRRRDLALAVSTDGRYRVVEVMGDREPQFVTCPPYQGFGESAYVRCVRLGRRLLIFEGPCS